jgi:hypothetical protein
MDIENKNNKVAADFVTIFLIGTIWGAAFTASMYGVLCLPYLAGRMVWNQLGSGIAGVVLGSIVFVVVLLFFLILLSGVGMSLAGMEQPMKGLSEKSQSRVMTIIVCLPFFFLILLIGQWGVPWW